MQLQEFNRTLLGTLLVSGALGMASQAHALTLTPFATPDNTTTWGSTQLANLSETDLETLVGAAAGSLGLVYKQNQSSPLPPDSGNGAANYTTTFTYESAGDASGATITWDGGLHISCPSCYLVVKDGNHDANNPPPWPQYVYSLGNWNGTDTITLSGFWPGPGSISNITIWNNAEPGGGGGGSLLPEADTYAMLLAGLGLVGFAARRKLR